MNATREIIQLQLELQQLQEQQHIMLEQQRKMVTTVSAVSTICRRVMEKNTTLTSEIEELRVNRNGDNLVSAQPMQVVDK
jgi:hypothetical protein